MIELLSNDKFLKGFGDHPLGWMNTTVAYFPILIYLFAKIHNARNILEVGVDYGYSSYYLASAAKENGGMFYGIDILQDMCDRTGKLLTESNLPHKLLCADTKKLQKLDFVDDLLDIAFLDGEHTTEAVGHEIELVYPLLKERGFGFIFIHDIVDMGNAGIWLKLKSDPRFETVGIEVNYGFGICRKLEGVRYEEKAKKFEVKHL
jgi:predicted O-methyltransferase YrrM